MSLWWFARRCLVRKMALPELLPTVWLAATAISGVNASALCGLSSISGLSHQTGRLYLNAVRRLQILCIGQDPLLELRGLHRCPVGKKLCPRLPITPAILQKIFQFWLRTPHQCEYILLWAAFCLGFFMVSCAQASSPAHQCQLLLLIC